MKALGRYFFVLALLIIYSLGLIVWAVLYHVSPEWLFYGLIPTALSLYLAIHSYHQNHVTAKHTEIHLRSLSLGQDQLVKDMRYIRERLP